MSATVFSEPDDLSFGSVIRGYIENPRFVRRDWLAAALDAKLAEPKKQFVLLTAEPGAGKSTFMAQLALDHPEWLRYFIRRDQNSVMADVSDKSLLLRVGYQLAARRPELFAEDQLRLSVSVEQHLGTVAEQAEAVGVEVKRLLDSPFHHKVVNVVQHAQSDRGTLIGLRVDELVAEPRLLDAKDLQCLALVAPARALERTDPTQRIIVLIDALDEIRYHPGRENILTWLTNSPELPENIRFVLTSRPPDAALNVFRHERADRLAELAIDEGDRNVQQDVEHFVATLIKEPVLAPALSATQGGVEVFARKAAAKAHGNLGYLDALARGIDQASERRDTTGLNALLSLKEVPADLQGLYAFFLAKIRQEVAAEQIVGKDSSGKTYSTDVWPAVYQPVLGVLAVAAEPVDAELIAKLGEIAVDITWVHPAVDRLRQFLDDIDGRFRFYHATVAEFLTAKKTHDSPETHPLYQDAKRWHERIVAHYAKAGSWATVDWNKVDAYGLLHLPSHLSALSSDPGYRNQLYEFVSRPLVLAKWERFGSLESLDRDLRTAMDVATQNKPLDCLDFMRCYLIERTLGSFVLSADVFRFIAAAVAQSGQLGNARTIIDQALDLASAIPSPGEKARTHSMIATFLFKNGFVDDAKEVIGRAFEETKLIKNVQEQSETLSAVVLDMASVQERERAREVACRALDIAESTDFNWARAISISSVADALWQIGEEELAKEAFSKALKAAWDVKDDDDRAYALCAVGAALERVGDKRAERVFSDAKLQLYRSTLMPPEEIEDEFSSIYVNYRASSAQNLDKLFAEALEIRDVTQRMAAMRSLAERVAKAVLYGNYPRPSAGELNIDRLCDRSTFLAIASQEAETSAAGETRLTLHGLCESILGTSS